MSNSINMLAERIVHSCLIACALLGLGGVIIVPRASSQGAAPNPGPSGGLSPNATLPPFPGKPNPLDKITPVTDAKLMNPPPGDWLTWRRTYDDLGFSPLKQIDKSNVGDLRVAWTWSLPERCRTRQRRWCTTASSLCRALAISVQALGCSNRRSAVAILAAITEGRAAER